MHTFLHTSFQFLSRAGRSLCRTLLVGSLLLSLSNHTYGDEFQALRSYWELGGTSAEPDYSDSESVDLNPTSGSLTRFDLTSFRPIVYFTGNTASTTNGVDVDRIAYLGRLGTTMYYLTGSSTSTSPEMTPSILRFTTHSDALHDWNRLPFSRTGFFGPIFLRYTLIDKDLSIEIEDRIVGENSTLISHPSVSRSFGDIYVYKSDLGWVPGISLVRPDAETYQWYVDENKENATEGVTDSTRFRLNREGYELWTGATRRVSSGAVTDAVGLAASDVKSVTDVEMHWQWKAERYRKISMQTDLEWVASDELSSVEIAELNAVGGVSLYEETLVLPEDGVPFARRSILYLDENFSNPTLEKTEATTYIATPLGYRYQINNEAGDSLDSHSESDYPETTLLLDLEHSATSDSNEYVSGVLTWIYEVEFNKIAVEISHSGLPVGFGIPSDSTTPATGVIFSGVDITFSAPEEVFWDQNKNPQSNSEGAYYKAVLNTESPYSVNGVTPAGGSNEFEVTAPEGDVRVIWQWDFQYAVIVKSAAGTGAAPRTVSSIDVFEGTGTNWLTLDDQITFSINKIAEDIETDSGLVRSSIESYTITQGSNAGSSPNNGQPITPSSIIESERVTSAEYRVRDWIEIEWNWVGQIKYTFDALSGGGLYENGAFIRVFDLDGVPGDYHYASNFNDFVWITVPELTADVGTKVEVGCFYRTDERRLTLADFIAAPGNDLAAIASDISLMRDEEVPGIDGEDALARVYTIDRARLPTSIHWNYQPTVYRAEVPLGEAVDLDSLVPALPSSEDGAVELWDQGPSEGIVAVGESLSPPGAGAPLRWDRVGKALYPVHPGSNQVDWREQDDPDRWYKIEVVSGYPEDTVPLASAREQLTGRREVGVDGDVRAVTLGGVSADFPATPSAHYRHFYDSSADRRVPTKLEISSTDEWNFQELTHFDAVTVARVDSSGTKAFSTTGAGRSVLLYSRRPNSDEIANGNLDEEALAVRVIQSQAITPILPDDPKYVLGRRGLELGSGASDDSGALGVVQGAGASTTSIQTGDAFVVDFWLNAKGLRADDEPVTIFSMGGSDLEVILENNESGNATMTANYRGISVVQPVALDGAEWRHYVIHVFEPEDVEIGTTLLNFYADGEREEQVRVTASLSGASPVASVGSTLTVNSLRLGMNANPLSRLQLDQFRLYDLSASLEQTYLQPNELKQLRTSREAELRSLSAQLWFDFESLPVSGSFASGGLLGNAVGIGPIVNDATSLYSGIWAHLDIQEVATRIDSTLDNAGFGGSGYILNGVSNYNSSLYNRAAEVGEWGSIFPVNHGQLYRDGRNRLEVAYYENLYLDDPANHPNVAWPYEVAAYDEVIFPTFGEHKDKAIYVASRIGSEGVDQTGRVQQIFDLSEYANLSIYNQPDRDLAGFNPNEEHALVAASARAGLKVKDLGDDIANNPPLAAYALQKDVNATLVYYTSDPWVLVQVDNLLTGEPEMAAYQVFATREGDPALPFPRPDDAAVDTVDGLAYESAENLEDRFLTIDPEGTYDFTYQFDYPVFAGDLLIPPYPLNLVIGSATMSDDRGGNIADALGNNQRTFWRDAGGYAWVVSGGGGQFFHQFYYPYRSDFYMGKAAPVAGTPVAWLPSTSVFSGGDADTLDPVKVVYTSEWRTDYPKLKRGETLTYQGGEYFNETPGADGLPALVAMAAAEIVYDSLTPEMTVAIASVSELDKASARIIRPLDRREVPFTMAQMTDSGLQPGAPDTSKVNVVAERWYFNELAGSLSNRFYFDSLAGKLVFRGLLNGKESGDSNLTVGPDPLNILEPNVMTPTDYDNLRVLGSDSSWRNAIRDLFKLSQNPNEVTASGLQASTTDPINSQGMKDIPTDPDLQSALKQLTSFWTLGGADFIESTYDVKVVQLDSFGVGAALVPNPNLLTHTSTESLYVTIAENNRPELAEAGAPVSLHIIEILPDRYRGAVKMIEGSDPFSEKVSLQHNGEFGANTEDLYYEWWIREAAPLDVVAKEVLDDGTLSTTDAGGNLLWEQYASGNNLHSIVFEGRPDVTLADKLVLMRYRHKDESDWALVPFEPNDPIGVWQPGSPAPFQWAGAANSPQLQADGSKRYVPQLIMGWVKRVLDRINPYEARYTDFFSGESPAAYTSQIQIAGAPFAGKVALNPDPDVIENVGLIELYETILQRARELSIDNSSNPVASPGINQALLLAATRLSVLYELLAREAYSDAQDSTITVTDDSGLENVVSYTHAFQNMEADLLHEELALLRGSDFLKSYPVYNRIFWNYAKGLGEAAYNINYNINDHNLDGFINEDDARALYPQGHGDAWGHFVSALDMHYELLQQPVFSWKARPELYSIMQNVLEVDFLDEKTFAQLAASKARAGRDIVRGTYRLHYTQDPDGQWQGYTDTVDPARAWGVSEWATRAGQGAYFDWAVANAILPEDATATLQEDFSDEELHAANLARLERSTVESEISEIIGGFYEIQVAMDEANGGSNPLGFDTDALSFDLDLEFYENASGGDRRSHFEQVYERALVAGNNAQATLSFAAQTENKLRRIADDTNGLINEAFSQDLDYRNRLIEIFGRPYEGTIGFGKVYPEGYAGPDTLLYAYLDYNKVSQIIPEAAEPSDGESTGSRLDFEEIKVETDFTESFLSDNEGLLSIYENALGSDTTMLDEVVDVYVEAEQAYADPSKDYERTEFQLPVRRTAGYAFTPDPDGDWGQRTSYGRVQQALEGMLLEEVAMQKTVEEYQALLKHYHTLTLNLQHEIIQAIEQEYIQDDIETIRKWVNGVLVGLEAAGSVVELAMTVTESVESAIRLSIPDSVGLSTDALSGLQAAAAIAASSAKSGLETTRSLFQISKLVAELARDEAIADLERNKARIDIIDGIENSLGDIARFGADEGVLRTEIGIHIQELEIRRQEYVTTLAEGFRLLTEREGFNTGLAAEVQSNRYQDMIFRLSRNEAMGQYQSAFNHAARYAWLTARAYDYETSLDPGDPAAPGDSLDQIVKERQLGLWSNGLPQSGQGGLAEVLNQLNANFQVLKGQLGINNPQSAIEKISLRSELFRIGDGDAASDDRWEDALKVRIVDDLNQMPEYTRYCRPLPTAEGVSQPGLVIRFSSQINPGVNFFGKPLEPGDHAYSSVNFATKIRGFGVWLENYNEAGLATTPRAYLVPAGNDTLRTSSSDEPITRVWNVVEQRIPTPFTINQSDLTSPGYIPTLNGIDGSFGQLRRHGDFRMYHDSGDTNVNDSELILDSRLIGRSVWNSEWLLIIPGANLHVDPDEGLKQFAEEITDIKLHFKTYSHQGQ
ncbi:MAG: hypothetical protein ACSHYA_12675 [Opitutaceae bacterium]